MLKELFKKTTESVSEKKHSKIKEKIARSMNEPEVPEGLFKQCAACGNTVYTEDIIANYHICPKCGSYFRIDARTRLSMILDTDSFIEWNTSLETSDPLEFPGYQKKITHLKKLTGLDEAVITGEGKIKDIPVAIAVMSPDFLMGSMGEVVGEKITRTIETATGRRLPVIIFCCSGGARMQEGIVSLMQMAKTSGALKKHDEAGLLYVSVLTDPTTGGVTASFAMLGDVIIAEPDALVGFAGPRVIEQTIGQKLPEGFQRAEFLLEHGLIDKIVERKNMKQVLYTLVRS
ncbi:acetyl-CoA carboxylase carboxyl transferase subunit beta [Mobilisporobacter senegalensis]|uniref:Acetyl-coenzyme A carboxylase carboxyl transferase subunit beta n=1 Tax=Mobilisporobacter senegalensis TaxID=1329262 RepID=A0A3N1XPZ0_9FIRM|nr:acetyl-CoA carboxylase carboxyl transferase subunit beta [Mobilisporobacter senegalensis]